MPRLGDLGAKFSTVIVGAGSPQTPTDAALGKIAGSVGAPSSTVVSVPELTIARSVGQGGVNAFRDVQAVRARLYELGFAWATLDEEGKPTADFIQAIKLFQGIVRGDAVWSGRDGLVEPGKGTERWLQATNAPRWMSLDDGSATLGYRYLIANPAWGDDRYCTHWTAGVIRAAGMAYLAALGEGATQPPITVHELSASRGQASGHLGHRTGLTFDVRLPRTDGGVGTTISEAAYDRGTTRKILQALRAQGLVRTDRLYFNDPVLIGEGLCLHLDEHDNHIHARISAPAQGPPLMHTIEAPPRRLARNLLGAPGLVRYLRDQDLLGTHRMDSSFARYVVLDADTHAMKVVANDTPGRTIDDIVQDHPQATAIINGTFFSGDLPMQSEGYLRHEGQQLPTSLPASVSDEGPPTPEQQRIDELVETATLPRYAWVGTADGSHLLFGSNHPPPPLATTAIGRLLRHWEVSRLGVSLEDYSGLSLIAYNPRERAILLLSRFGATDSPMTAATTSGAFDIDELEGRIRTSGFTQHAYLDGGSSVALFVRRQGVLIRGKRHLSAQSSTQTVTSYLVFEPLGR